MTESKPVFIADSCIGGLSVLKSMWDSGAENDVVFWADYAINPLGVKSDAIIAEVAGNWLRIAAEYSDTLVIGCNTLSIRYCQLDQSDLPDVGLEQVVSMVDCFKAMAEIEAPRLKHSRVLVLGTAFTASQPVYPDILDNLSAGIQVSTVAATELERKVARFQPWESEGDSVITAELRQALGNSDFAVLACTCFPMVKEELEALFPDVVFLDPGAYCSGLLDSSRYSQNRKLRVTVSGDVVSPGSVENFAESYLQKL